MYCSCVHTSIGCGAMLCFAESTCYCNSLVLTTYICIYLSALTTYVYSCHTSLTVMPLSVYV